MKYSGQPDRLGRQPLPPGHAWRASTRRRSCTSWRRRSSDPGRKTVPPQAKPPVETYNELETEGFDDVLQRAGARSRTSFRVAAGQAATRRPTSRRCPCSTSASRTNEKLLGYWDTVADRLYKIRHCMNIEGVVRQLAAVRAADRPGAAGQGGRRPGSTSAPRSADLNAPLPLYRFNVLLQKANEVCSDVKALGARAARRAGEEGRRGARAAAAEPGDPRCWKRVKAVREQQIDEAKENLEGLKKVKELVETRRDYYRDIARVHERAGTAAPGQDGRGLT